MISGTRIQSNLVVEGKVSRGASNRAKLKKLATALGIAVMTAAGTVQAEKIAFEFNRYCEYNSFSCRAVPSIGTVTLSDSLVDPNRVDFTLVVSPQRPMLWLEMLYLNYNGYVGGIDRFVSIVDVSSPPDSVGDETGNGLWIDKTYAAGGALDISADLHRSPLTVSGSLVLRTQRSVNNELVSQPYNLDLAMFDEKDGYDAIYAALRAASPETLLWYGATVSYRISEPDVLPIGDIALSPPPAGAGSSGDGVSSADAEQPSAAFIQAAVAEPGTLALLGLATGFLGWVVKHRKRSHV
jgi:hypothetical protein